MMRNLLFIVIAQCFYSCSDDDGCETGNGTFLRTDPVAPPDLFIELVDEDGENLIENGTYDSSEITVEREGSVIAGVVFKDVAPIRNLILVNVIGNEGDNEVLSI